MPVLINVMARKRKDGTNNAHVPRLSLATYGMVRNVMIAVEHNVRTPGFVRMVGAHTFSDPPDIFDARHSPFSEKQICNLGPDLLLAKENSQA